ncbi:TetR/AcrR family transcriptional regulator [Rhodococcus sp. Z13]|uniref:TetR/AcrR family transcriptional regulator n=1 Tax=Rhodococcus sacchari TaxID=2962047 RepID=A0ACD4DJC2_9NOCA|nr:TetR/AcrR family transcriptional regulator [Rhodococcus sp. Z13]UYP20107.1 TetR/AcrR family transcriptional regulator [Rhodococcus sp. Z13]
MSNRLPADERRTQLVDAALELAEDGGVGAVTVRAVAEKAGVSLGVVHYCFESKEALVVAMAHTVVDQLLEAMQAAFDVPADGTHLQGIERLRAMLLSALRAMWSAVDSTRGLQILTYEITTYSLRHRAGGPATSGDIAAQQYRRMDEQAVAFLDACAERSGVCWTLPTEAVARLALALLDGFVLRWLVDRNADAGEAELDTIADVIASRAVTRP